MIFGLFKSKREKFKIEGEKMLDNYIQSLRGLTPEEIGGMLDLAVRIKHSSSMYGSKKDVLILFEDPMLVSNEVAFGILGEWREYMLEISGSLEGRAKVGALTIWYLSLLTCHIAELRIKGRELWKQLERGYNHCNEFNIETDCVIGLEPFKE